MSLELLAIKCREIRPRCEGNCAVCVNEDPGMLRKRMGVGDHSHGPWHIIPHPEYSGSNCNIHTAKNASWASFGGIGYVSANNAKLISKAPDMLALLKDIANHHNQYPGVKKARELIKEIEGVEDDCYLI